MLTVSNAFDMSSAMTSALFGLGVRLLFVFFELSAFVMVWFMLCSAVLVEWLGLKPCWVGSCAMLFVMCGSSAFSRTFAMGERSAIGL